MIFFCFCGDFNINFSDSFDQKVIDLKENFVSFGLNQIVLSPTYPSKNPKSL